MRGAERAYPRKPMFVLCVVSGLLIGACIGCCDEAAIPSMQRRLYSEAARDRNDAALALARCGTDADSAVGRLAELLYDSNVGVQSAAAYALRKIDSVDARSALERAEARRRSR